MAIVLESKMRDTLRKLGRSSQRLNKLALIQTGEWWHDKIMPKHFLPSAKTTYRYQRRKRVTKAIKEARGQNPEAALLATQQSMRFVSVDPKIRATSTRGRVIMSAPSYWAQKDPGEPDKEDELTAINDADRRRMGDQHSKALSILIAEHKGKSKAERTA